MTVIKHIKIGLVTLFGVLLAVPSMAAAATMEPINGILSLRFDDIGTEAGNDGFKLTAYFGGEPTQIADGGFSFGFTDVQANLFDLSNNQLIGTADVDLAATLAGLSYSDPNLDVDFIGREGSSTRGQFTIDNITIDGRSPTQPSRTVGFTEKFANITENSNPTQRENYQELVGSGPFSSVSADELGWTINDLFTTAHLWIAGVRNITILGKTYSIKGDIHGNFDVARN